MTWSSTVLDRLLTADRVIRPVTSDSTGSLVVPRPRPAANTGRLGSGSAATDRTSEGILVMAREERDVERIYSTQEVVAKLRRLADALEQDKPFRIQIAGERIWVPERAAFSIEHERGDDEEEIEFQLKWPLTSTEDDDSDTTPLV
jgi:amphi-Trp domain-containing protein